MKNRRFLQFCAALTLAAALEGASPSAAQLLPGGLPGTLGRVVGPPVENTLNSAGALPQSAVRELEQVRRDTLQSLRRQHGDVIDIDPHGDAIVRSEVIAIAPSAAALAAAEAQGFTETQRLDPNALGVSFVVLHAPRGMSTRRALDHLRRLDPQGAYDFNHLYLPSGDASAASAPAAQVEPPAPNARVGMIDSGVDANHPDLAGARITQRGFTQADARATEHGTAVASLIAGAHGAAPGASLFVADVYGADPAGGGAAAIIAAFGWLAEAHTPVVNVSLVGPDNRALEAAVHALTARGVLVVAAVGNDGPNAPPLYPAAYPGVIGVTGVDARNRALPEAERGAQVAFAAPGMIRAAALNGRSADVRGTSFAAPIVAGLLARRMGAPDPAAAQQARADLARSALDLGARGPDPVFGAGLVGGALRTPERVAQH